MADYQAHEAHGATTNIHEKDEYDIPGECKRVRPT